jgi:hypothetical protein
MILTADRAEGFIHPDYLNWGAFMEFEKLQKDVGRIEKIVENVKKGEAPALREFAVGLRDIIVALLKDRKEPIRQGQIFRDAAAKNLLPGDVAPRADALLVRWGGHVTPADPQTVREDAARLAGVAEKLLPVLKAYQKSK